MRSIWHGLTPMLLLAALPSTAGAADGETAAIMRECGASELPATSVDSCLERLRVLDETNPTPELESLQARLEQVKSGRRPPGASGPPVALQPLQETTVAGPAPLSPRPIDRADNAVPGGDDALAPYSRGDRDAVDSGESAHDDPAYRSDEASGSAMDEDEPPVADPPDDAAPSPQSDDPR